MGGHANPKTRREESGGVCREGERDRVRERKRERACTWEREKVRKHFGSSFYMFFPETEMYNLIKFDVYYIRLLVNKLKKNISSRY